MDDRSLYATILGLSAPWDVERVELRETEHVVHVWVTAQVGTRFVCPECGEPGPICVRMRASIPKLRRNRPNTRCQHASATRAETTTPPPFPNRIVAADMAAGDYLTSIPP
jgi:hypothetical protein